MASKSPEKKRQAESSTDSANTEQTERKRKEWAEITLMLKSFNELKKAELAHSASINKIHTKIQKTGRANGLNVKNVKKCRKAYQVFLDNAKQQAILIAQIQEKLLMYQRFEAEVLSTVDDHEEAKRKKRKTEPEKPLSKSVSGKTAGPLPTGPYASASVGAPSVVPQKSESTSKLESGKQVIARVEKEGQTMWILATIRRLLSENPDVYEVEDAEVDFENEAVQEKYILALSSLIPLGKITDKVLPAGSEVLALYPDTSCFYKGIVVEPASKPSYLYSVTFEDDDNRVRVVSAVNLVPYPKSI